MPIELDFWAENLNQGYRKKDIIANNSSNKPIQKTSSRSFSIFEDK